MIPIGIVGVIFIVRQGQNQAQTDAVSFEAERQLKRHEKLLEAIKYGMREYEWRNRTEIFWRNSPRRGEVLFEVAHVVAYHVKHFVETRVRFYLKVVEEFGMWSGFAGNGDEYIESYYRTDRTFKTEELLAD